jgi:DMSO reductase anchor subunit
MHPAKSVIFFTTATGAGYGLFIWLAVLALMGILPESQAYSLTALLIGFGLIVGGLLSSTFHLGRPERAWRALSQWRSSWLSREGVMAILTFFPLGLFGIYWLFLSQTSGMVTILAGLGAVMSLITVFTTSMIYASLKAIPAWHNLWTKAGYLVLCLMSGALLTMALSSIFGFTDQALHLFFPTTCLLVLGLLTKLMYWRSIHSRPAISTAESATGLGRFGKVALAASPHGEDNYLLKEMGFKIARKHARKIRIIASLFGFILPFLLLVGGMHMLGGQDRMLSIVAAAISCGIGLVFERWLFFAEAKHVVTLYYGESQI